MPSIVTICQIVLIVSVVKVLNADTRSSNDRRLRTQEPVWAVEAVSSYVFLASMSVPLAAAPLTPRSLPPSRIEQGPGRACVRSKMWTGAASSPRGEDGLHMNSDADGVDYEWTQGGEERRDKNQR